MKNLLLFFALFISFQAKSQTQDTASWSPAGAVWVYGVPTTGARVYLKQVYEKDTIIQNINVKKIDMYFFDYIGDLTTQVRGGEIYLHTDFAYESNDTVYMLVRDTFRVQYVFSAQVGDKWEITETGHYYQFNGAILPPTDSVTVRSISPYYTAGLTQITMFAGTSWGIGDIILKNIGAYRNPYPLPTAGYTTGFEYADGMECYYDDTRGYITFVDAWRPCRELVLFYADLIPVAEIEKPSPTVKVFPNPAYSEVFIDVQAENLQFNELSLRVLNNLGQLFVDKKIVNQQSISIAQLPAGIYYFVVSDDKTFSKPIKIVKL